MVPESGPLVPAEGLQDQDVGSEKVTISFRDPAAVAQEQLLDPQLSDAVMTLSEHQDRFWQWCIPHAFYTGQHAWVFTRQRPDVHHVYPSLFILSGDGASTGCSTPATAHRSGVHDPSARPDGGGGH